MTDRISSSDVVPPPSTLAASDSRPAEPDRTELEKAFDACKERKPSMQDARNAEVAERVQQLLRSSPYLALRTIVCEFDGESLFLRGRVPTFHSKQVAFTVVNRLGMNFELIDQLEVVPPTYKSSRRRSR